MNRPTPSTRPEDRPRQQPGPVSFELDNTGAEAHALIVARKLDEVEGSALDAFNALESEEAFPTAFEQTAVQGMVTAFEVAEP